MSIPYFVTHRPARPHLDVGGADAWDLMTKLSSPALTAGPAGLPVKIEGADSGATTLGELMRLFGTDGKAVYAREIRLPELGYGPPEPVITTLRELDWFQDLPEEVRPDWLWIMLGTTGTSSPTHVDVMLSSAWNTLIEGEKHWRFESPDIARRDGHIPDGIPLPDVASETIEFVQYPGDIVWTPSCWAHSVRNTKPSIAITGNFVDESNIDVVTAYVELVRGTEDAEALRALRRAREGALT
jgi:hypothetical protein